MIDQKLKTFLNLAKIKNYTKTAQILNITQPAVSQHVKALERYYNVSLIHKEGKDISLTQEGVLLYRYAVELNRLSKTIKHTLENRKNVTKKYHLGATLTLGGYVIPQIIGNYKRENKNTEIILYVKNTDSILKMLLEGDIDLGVIEGPFDKTKVKYSKYKDDELVFVVSPKSIYANKPFVTIQEVLNSNLILREKGSGTRKIFEDKLTRNGYSFDDISIYMEIGDITALLSLVEADIGSTIISKEAIKSGLKENKLIQIPIKNFKIEREFNFVYVKSYDNMFIDDFIKYSCNRIWID